MTKLPLLSSKEVIKTLHNAGFEDAPERGKGNHRALVKRGSDKIPLVILPDGYSGDTTPKS